MIVKLVWHENERKRHDDDPAPGWCLKAGGVPIARVDRRLSCDGDEGGWTVEVAGFPAPVSFGDINDAKACASAAVKLFYDLA